MSVSSIQVVANTRKGPFAVSVNFSDEKFYQGHATLQVRGVKSTLQADAFFSLAQNLIRNSSREWADFAVSYGLQLQSAMSLSTFEQNAIKALFMIAVWLEPLFVGANERDLPDQLLDELVVEYTGAVGPQRYIYFPRSAAQNANAELIGRLFDLCLLAKARVAIGGTRIERVLVPLVTPGVRVDEFDRDLPPGVSAYRYWRAIREDLSVRVARLASSVGSKS